MNIEDVHSTVATENAQSPEAELPAFQLLVELCISDSPDILSGNYKIIEMTN